VRYDLDNRSECANLDSGSINDLKEANFSFGSTLLKYELIAWSKVLNETEKNWEEVPFPNIRNANKGF